MPNTPRKTKTKTKINPISTHLLKGRSVSETAKLLNISTSRIYEYAAAHNLPTNKPILPGSQREAQVLNALSTFPPTTVAALLRVIPSHIADVRRRTRKSPRSKKAVSVSR